MARDMTDELSRMLQQVAETMRPLYESGLMQAVEAAAQQIQQVGIAQSHASQQLRETLMRAGGACARNDGSGLLSARGSHAGGRPDFMSYIDHQRSRVAFKRNYVSCRQHN